jgi:small subunit ribosomal protein S21
MPTIIKAKPGDSSDDVIKKFKRQVVQDQVLTEYRKRERYEKPSETKKKKKNELKRRQRHLKKKNKK